MVRLKEHLEICLSYQISQSNHKIHNAIMKGIKINVQSRTNVIFICRYGKCIGQWAPALSGQLSAERASSSWPSAPWSGRMLLIKKKMRGFDGGLQSETAFSFRGALLRFRKVGCIRVEVFQWPPCGPSLLPSVPLTCLS